eukprot:4326085-Amphidinium_carterae.2
MAALMSSLQSKVGSFKALLFLCVCVRLARLFVGMADLRPPAWECSFLPPASLFMLRIIESCSLSALSALADEEMGKLESRASSKITDDTGVQCRIEPRQHECFVLPTMFQLSKVHPG